jgi:hypothetical protein
MECLADSEGLSDLESSPFADECAGDACPVCDTREEEEEAQPEEQWERATVLFPVIAAATERVVVFVCPGEKVPSVYNYNGFKSPFENVFEAICLDDDFVPEDLPPALNEFYRRALKGDMFDVENFCYAMAFRYPFYIVNVEG